MESIGCIWGILVPNTDPLKNIRIVLCAPAHPGNIGAAARAMKTMGLGRLYLVAPRRFPDPEADWRASRATDVLAHATICATLGEALHGVGLAVACSARSRELAVPRASARAAAADAVSVARAQQVALVFGNETFGLTTAEVNCCQMLAAIPANPRYPSLNLAAAVQVMAYELWLAARGDKVEQSKVPQLASHEDLERFYAHLERAMIEVGFFNPAHPRKLMPRLRRLFGRARVEQEEINILRGIVASFERGASKRAGK
jgi:tRNA/rRNA methyltransferase